MDNGDILLCDLCNSKSLAFSRIDPATKIYVWRCSNCGSIKRRCNLCEEDWLLKEEFNNSTYYTCPECENTYESPDKMLFKDGISLKKYFKEKFGMTDYDPKIPVARVVPEYEK